MGVCAMECEAHFRLLLQMSLLITSAAFFFPTDGEVTPGQMNKLVGENVTITCTLTNSALSLRSSYLYFETNDGMVQENLHYYQRVIDEDSIALELNELTIEHSGKYYCYLNQSSIGEKDKHIGYSALNVGEPPEIGNMTCISKHHEDMTCSFCPPDYPSEDLAIYQIYYKTSFDTNWLRCPVTEEYGGCICHWCSPLDTHNNCDSYENLFKPFTDYSITVYVNNDFGSENRTFQLYTDVKIVKPNPVLNMDIHEITPTSLQLRFDPPKVSSTMKLQYKVHLNPLDTSKQSQVYNIGSMTSFEIRNLSAFHEYNVSVTCRPGDGGYDSDPVSSIIQTPQDAPNAAPCMPATNFKTGKECKVEDHKCHDTTFYWEEISQDDKNGKIAGYLLEVGTIGSQQKYIRNITNGSVMFHTVEQLLDEEEYRVCVEAYNIESGTPLISPRSCISKPKLSQVGSHLENVTAELIAGEKLHIWWTVVGDIDSVVLFSCRGQYNNLTACEGPPESKFYTSNTTSIVEPWKEKYVYSLGVNATVASGLTESWLCYYAFDTDPDKVVEFQVTAEQERSLLVKWSPVTCVNPATYGRPLAYQVYWACTSGVAGNALLPPTDSRHHIDGLPPFSECDVSIVTVGSGDRRSLWTNATERTLESVPEAPVNLRVSDVQAHSMFLKWDVSPVPNGVVTAYRVYVNDELYKETEEHAREVDITDREGFVNYTLQVCAVNGAGESAKSQPTYVKTLVTAPSKVKGVEVTGTNDTHVKLTWERPQPANGRIEYYIVQRSWGGETVNTTVVNEEGTVALPECGRFGNDKSATFTVVAINEDDTGEEYASPPSDPTTATICANLSPWEIVVIVVAVICLVLVCAAVVAVIKYCKKYWWKNIDIIEPPEKEVDVQDNRAFESHTVEIQRINSKDSGFGGTPPPSQPTASPQSSISEENSDEGNTSERILSSSSEESADFDEPTSISIVSDGAEKQCITSAGSEADSYACVRESKPPDGPPAPILDSGLSHFSGMDVNHQCLKKDASNSKFIDNSTLSTNNPTKTAVYVNDKFKPVQDNIGNLNTNATDCDSFIQTISGPVPNDACEHPNLSTSSTIAEYAQLANNDCPSSESDNYNSGKINYQHIPNLPGDQAGSIKDSGSGNDNAYGPYSESSSSIDPYSQVGKESTPPESDNYNSCKINYQHIPNLPGDQAGSIKDSGSGYDYVNGPYSESGSSIDPYSQVGKESTPPESACDRDNACNMIHQSDSSPKELDTGICLQIPLPSIAQPLTAHHQRAMTAV